MDRRLILLTVLIVAAGGLGGVPMVDATDQMPTVENRPVGEAAGVSTQQVVGAGLSNASGTVTAVARMPEPPQQVIRATEKHNRVTAMQTHAASVRRPLERFAAGHPHVTIEHRLWLANAVVLSVDTEQVPLGRLAAVENVVELHENYAVSASETTAAPTPGEVMNASGVTASTSTVAASGRNSYTRAQRRISVPEAHAAGSDGAGVEVAVIDTGVNPSHPDIDITQDHWRCFIDCAGNPEGPHDVDGHGTHVSATVTGGDHNDQQLQLGVAPNATLLHAKGLGDDGAGTFRSLTDSMQWAVEQDADIISVSLGTAGTNDHFIDVVQNAHDSGAVVIAAIGNNGAGTSGSPGNLYNTVSVGSVNVEPAFPADWEFEITDDTVTEFSGGERIDSSEWESPPAAWPDSYVVPDVTAPGAIVWSADNDLQSTSQCGGLTVPSDDLACLAGTSMATPHVAGVAALMQANSDTALSATEIQSTLRNTAVDIGEPATRQGAGRIDADAAVAAVSSVPTGPDDITGDGISATDPNGDGLYEDINGDGTVTFIDIAALYQAIQQDRINTSNMQYFNFNGAGAVSLSDIQALYSQAVSGNQPSGSAGTTEIIMEPTATTVGVGDTTTVEIKATNVDGGIGAYDFAVNTTDSGPISITDATAAAEPSIGEGASVASAGSRAMFEGVVAETTDSGMVTLGTVTIAGDDTGEAQLSIDMNELGDEAGTLYTVTETTGSTLTVEDTNNGDNDATTVSLQPAEKSVPVGDEQTYDLVVNNIDNGVTGFYANITVGDTDVAEIVDGTEMIGFDVGPGVEVAADGSSVQIDGVSTSGSSNTGEVTIGTVTVSGITTGETMLNIDDDVSLTDQGGNGYTISDTTGAAVTVFEDRPLPPGDSDDSRTVSLRPTEQSLATGGEQTYDVIVDNASDGVGSLDTTISAGNVGIIEIIDATENIGVDIGPGAAVASDGSSVQISGSSTSGVSATGEVIIATVTVSGVNTGETSLTVDSASVGDQSGNSYTIAGTSGASVTVTSGPTDVTGNGDAPTDPDGDGRYEDVNGNGAVGFSDLTALFDAFSNDRINSANQQFFNFNGQGGVGFADITALYNNELSSSA